MDPKWNCAEVPNWKPEMCCRHCHAKDEPSFMFRLKGLVKKLCCKYSAPFINLHAGEDIVILDDELLLAPTR